MENPGEHEGCILHVPKLNTYQSSRGRRSRRTLLLLSLFISKKVQFKTLPKSDHCLSSHSRRRNTVPPTTHIALTHGPTCSFVFVYQCPRSRLFVCSRETRHLVLSSSFRLWIHAVALPSLQYQESRNSDLFSAIPITTRMGSMPSVTQASPHRLVSQSPSFISCRAPLRSVLGTLTRWVRRKSSSMARGWGYSWSSRRSCSRRTGCRCRKTRWLAQNAQPEIFLALAPSLVDGCVLLLTIPLVSRSAGSRPASSWACTPRMWWWWWWVGLLSRALCRPRWPHSRCC